MEPKKQIKCREFLGSTVMAVAGISSLGLWAKTVSGLNRNRLIPTQHGRGYTMVIVGTKTPFFSHQPMFGSKTFNSPYRYQVILEANFGDQQKAYEEARRKDKPGEKILYTFDPQDFVLSKLNLRTTPLTQLTGSIFRFRVGDDVAEPVAEQGFKTTVRKIHFQVFSSRLRKPTQLEYIMFGKPPEIFMAHVITRPPDFDHIVSLKALDLPSLSTDSFRRELSRGLKIILNAKNSIEFRPRPKQVIDARSQTLNSKNTIPIRFEVESELYLEEGELRSPPEYAPTLAEKEAGFP